MLFVSQYLSLLVVMLVALLVSGTALGLETASAESMIKNINISNTPLGVAFNPSNGYTYATNKDLGTVSVIDSSTNEVIKDIPVGLQPSAIVFDPNSSNIYVTNQYSKTVSVIDSSTNTVIDTIPMDERTSIPISVRLAS
ncbi:MAG: YncE family protein [Nitrososphaeraceae archaeon]